MRIMFMGTPEIAATCLEKVVNEGLNVVAVVTGKDKVRGRGKTLTSTPTKAKAEEKGIPVYTPDTLRTEEFMEVLRECNPDLILVVAYGKILPPQVLEYPKYGCINVHVSLLPKFRGAAPMQRAIIEGESETGVTIMYMAEGLDTGDIISQKAFPITEGDDFETVHDRSAVLGGEMAVEAIRAIASGTASRTPQDDSLATYAAKIEKEDCRIDFSLPAERLSCIIRGVTPIPGAFAYLGDKMIKLFGVSATKGRGEVGEVIDTNPKGEGSFTVACGEGALVVRGVIPEGKGRMSAGDFLRGRKLNLGDRFT